MRTLLNRTWNSEQVASGSDISYNLKATPHEKETRQKKTEKLQKGLVEVGYRGKKVTMVPSLRGGVAITGGRHRSRGIGGKEISLTGSGGVGENGWEIQDAGVRWWRVGDLFENRLSGGSSAVALYACGWVESDCGGLLGIRFG